MAEIELKKMSRAELLDMLITVSNENETLRKQLREMEKKLQEREIRVNRVGSIAEASLQLNGVFEAAEAAAAQYLENVKRQERINDQLEEAARKRASQILATAIQKANQIEEEAQRNADSYWNSVSRRLEKFYAEHQGLRELLQYGKQKR